MGGIIIIMMLLFNTWFILRIGQSYCDKDVIALMNKSISGLASFLVLIFFAAQFTAHFNKSI